MEMRIDRRQMLQMLAMGAATMGFGLPQGQPRRSFLLVTNSEGDDISVIDLEHLTLAGDWKVGERPHGIAVPANGHVAYTTIENRDSHKFSIGGHRALIGTPGNRKSAQHFSAHAVD